MKSVDREAMLTDVLSNLIMTLYINFFFQAEDGIRDWSVTGVQTCALPISGCGRPWPPDSVRGRYPAAGRAHRAHRALRNSRGRNSALRRRRPETRRTQSCGSERDRKSVV